MDLTRRVGVTAQNPERVETKPKAAHFTIAIPSGRAAHSNARWV